MVPEAAGPESKIRGFSNRRFGIQIPSFTLKALREEGLFTFKKFVMVYYVYILESETSGKFYIGQTNNIEKRLDRHNAGYEKYTKNRGPWRVHFYLEVESQSEAIKMERRLKNFKSRKRVLQWIADPKK